MMIVEMVIASIVCIFVPLLVGDLLLPNETLGKQYLLGFLGTLAVSQVLFIPFIIFQHHFTPYFLVYLLIIVGLCIVSIVKRHVNYKERFHSIVDFKNQFDSINVWMICAILLIGFQVVRAALCRFFVYADNARYIPIINDIIETDLDYYLDYTYGIPGNREINIKYLVTTYFPYLASICKVSGVHPAVLVQTLLPVLFTIALYMLVWDYGVLLFKDKRQSWIMEFFFAILVETMSGYLLTHANHVVVDIYFGKKIVFTLFVPFIMLFVAEKTSLLEDEVKCLNKKDLLRLMMLVLGASAVSLMGTGLTPIVLLSMGVVLSVRKKSIIPMVQMIIGMSPSLLVLIMVIPYMIDKG